jgi:hypothetical protein
MSHNFSIKRWVRACFLGWLLGVILVLLLSSFLDFMGIENLQFYLGTGMGAGIGFAQWHQLRKYLKVNTYWILASIFGMTLPFLIVDQLSFGTYEQKLPVCIALGGLVVGLLQYLLLKPNLNGSQLWIAGSVISWILGSSMVFLVNYTKQLNHDLFNNLILALINLILILSGGVVIGLVSGAITKRLLLKNLN